MWIKKLKRNTEQKEGNSENERISHFDKEEYYSWLSEVDEEKKKWKDKRESTIKKLEKKLLEDDDSQLLDKINPNVFKNKVNQDELKEICKKSIKDWMLEFSENGKIKKVYIDVWWEKKPSKLFDSLIDARFSPEQALNFRLQVRTKSFKDWFGDWSNDPKNASKIVDGNGEPLVVYHGSARRFEKFDINKIGSTTGDNSGFYFSNNKKISKDYYSKETGSILNNLKLMLGVSKKFKPTVYDCFLKGSNPYIHDFGGKTDNVGREKMIAEAKKAGHDCVILKNIIDGPDVVQDVYVVFHPNQIRIESM